MKWDVIIVGSGPAGLGTAFELINKRDDLKILMIDRERVSTGGLRNDCKMNFTFPIGFPDNYWTAETAEHYLEDVKKILTPPIMPKVNLGVYQNRAEKLGTRLINIEQAHLGTDGGLDLIHRLCAELEERGITLSLGEEMTACDSQKKVITTLKDGDAREHEYGHLVLAPGRKGFRFLQKMMEHLNIDYFDNVVDIGIRVETRMENYPIVKDYYDPKFMFPNKVRTFCTNSGSAYVVQEKYTTSMGNTFYSVNGHAWSEKKKRNNALANFAMLKTVRLTEPLASGQRFAEILGMQAMVLGGGRPIMQRVGDFRMGKRSKSPSFNDDLYDFEPTLSSCTPGDISLAMPSRILRGIWKSMKTLDTIIPGILHPGTIMYYPEIKMYANKPLFSDEYFQAAPCVYLIGDGAGTSRGITGAWASGIRAARGILSS